MVKKPLKSLSKLDKILQGTFLFFLISGILFFTGCSKKIKDLSIINYGGQVGPTAKGDSLKIHFNGVACFLFEYNGRAVLTDPFISNPPIRKVLFGRIRTDTALVDKYAKPEDLAKVNLVAVGHAHYDHLLDLPYMASNIPAYAKFCGSETMKHTLAPADLPQQIISVNDIAADSIHEGKWIYSSDSTIRLMAALSTHPPHFGKVILYNGPYTRDLDKLPRKTRQWKCGQPLSYLIDFLDVDRNTIAYRIFFQSSGSKPKKGFFPPLIISQRKVDVAVFGIANEYDQTYYPYKAIDFMHPDVLFVAHWEDFMRRKEKLPYKAVPTGNPEKFYEAIKSEYEDKPIILPAPGSSFVIYGFRD